ncbi:hypothetical protein H6771_01910 [Candidatus Peribacteria bacterium]|nr:hypothetical protein [Candidatus Peribacteria bacterium]
MNAPRHHLQNPWLTSLVLIAVGVVGPALFSLMEVGAQYGGIRQFETPITGALGSAPSVPYQYALPAAPLLASTPEPVEILALTPPPATGRDMTVLLAEAETPLGTSLTREANNLELLSVLPLTGVLR